MFDPIKTLCELATAERLAKIGYQKLSEKEPTYRTVEAYRFVASDHGVSINCWQLDPTCDEPCWKMFRVDRIKDVMDGGADFKPRRTIGLETGELVEFTRLCARKGDNPEGKYRDFLRKAIMDHAFSEQEQTTAENLCRRVSSARRKVVHTQVYSEVLFDVLLDNDISEEEEEFMNSVRGFFETVGWAP